MDRTHRRANHRHPVRDDSGAAMVEAAFVTPIFLLMLFAIIEFSGYVAAATGANSAVREAARMSSVQGKQPMADQAALERMDRMSAGLAVGADTISEVKIWRAATHDADPPEPCDASTECNHYVQPEQSGGAFELASLPLTGDSNPPAPMSAAYADCHFGYGSFPTASGGCVDANRLDQGWPPSERNVLETHPDNVIDCIDNPACVTSDMVGIWVKVHHRYYTGLFGNEVVVTAKAIAKIEPGGYAR